MKPIFRSIKNFLRNVGIVINRRAVHQHPHCTNINSLLLHLCDFDSELHKWVLQWIAYPLRNPGAKMATCLLVNGPQGTGKSLFFEGVVARLYGDAARAMPGAKLFGDYNAWTDRARLVVIDGSYTKPAAAKLKSLVSSDRIFINDKFKDTRVVPNNMNFVFITGEFDFLPAGAQDRRFMVIEAPPAREPLFYRAVVSEINTGGLDAFREFLMVNLDMTGFDERTMPPAAPHYRSAKEAA
jgi:putative DNA primase/helicase